LEQQKLYGEEVHPLAGALSDVHRLVSAARLASACGPGCDNSLLNRTVLPGVRQPQHPGQRAQTRVRSERLERRTRRELQTEQQPTRVPQLQLGPSIHFGGQVLRHLGQRLWLVGAPRGGLLQQTQVHGTQPH